MLKSVKLYTKTNMPFYVSYVFALRIYHDDTAVSSLFIDFAVRTEIFIRIFWQLYTHLFLTLNPCFVMNNYTGYYSFPRKEHHYICQRIY